MEKKLFYDNTILKRNSDDFLCTEVDGETVIMNAETGQYFGFNSVSTDIWNFMEDEITFNSLIEKLVSEYEVEKSVCDQQTRSVLASMLVRKIISKEEGK